MRWTFLTWVIATSILSGCSGANGDPAPTVPEGGADAAVVLPCIPSVPDAAIVEPIVEAGAGPFVDGGAGAVDGG